MNSILSTTRKTLIVFIIAQLSFVNLPAQNFDWKRTNPGCGGSFSIAKVGPIGHIVACSDLGGAYYSTDLGASWGVYGNNAGIPQTHFSSVGFDFNNDNIFYIGTEDGIYRTTNKGNRFEEVLDNGYIEDIVVAKSNSNIVYAAWHPFWNSPDGAIYKSTDEGQTWQQVSTNLPRGLRILKLLVDSTNADRIYLLSGKGDFACTEAEVYTSSDGGRIWTHISLGLEPVLDITLKAGEPGKIYLTTQNANCDPEIAPYYWTDLDGVFWSSTNYGYTWTKRSDRTGQIWPKANNEIILIDPRGTYEWNEYSGTWVSDDEGVSWNNISNGVDNYETGYIDSLQRSYGVSDNGICKTIGTSQSEEDSIAIWVNSQFVYLTTDDGENFRQVFTNEVSEGSWQSRGIDNVVMYDLEINEQNSDIMYAGYFDIGFWRSFDQGESWQPSNPIEYTGDWYGNGGNAMTILSDPARENVVWTAMKGNFGDNAFLLKSTNYGDSWTPRQNGLDRSPYMYSLVLDRRSDENNRTLYVSSGGNIYKGVNDGLNWSQVYGSGGMRVLAVDFFNSNYVYAGGENGFYRTVNGGETWEDTGLSAFEGEFNEDEEPFQEWDWEGVIDIYTDREKEGLLYVAVHGTGKGLYKSEDRGENWELIRNDNHARSVTANPNNNNQLFFGSSSAYKSGGFEDDSNGILYSENQGEDWLNITANSTYPFATTVNVTKQTSNQKVFVGSPGTGFQYAPLPESDDENENPDLGDVNCDNNVNAVDALFILQYVVGLRNGTDVCPLPEGDFMIELNGDANGNGGVDAVDALFVLQCTVGISNDLCPE